MTALEMARALSLKECRLPPASMTKRFARDLRAQIKDGQGTITEKQAAYLAVCSYRFRRQIRDKRLVPQEAPPGYETPKQRMRAAEANNARYEMARRIEEKKKHPIMELLVAAE